MWLDEQKYQLLILSKTIKFKPEDEKLKFPAIRFFYQQT